MINDQINSKELAVILRELEKVLKVKTDGEVVELGCYKGATSLELMKIIDKQAPYKKLYLYDSFEGLPHKTHQDISGVGEQFKTGELPASKKEVIRRFRQSGLPMPVIKKGWFSELEPSDLPELISFVFLDGDFYASIMDSLTLVWPRLSEGAIVIIDDYQSEALPGVQKAVDEWLKTHPARILIEASLAVIKI